jgi:hypothetical protein
MHTREDLYRRAIRELQEELDAKDSDRKKALRKLKSTKNEIEVLTDRLTELQAAYQATITTPGGAGRGGANEGEYTHQHENIDHSPSTSSTSTKSMNNVVGVHVTVLLSAGAVWWFSQIDHAALHWKLVFSMFFPLLWAYVSWTAAGESSTNSGSGSPRKRRETPLLMLCAAWFLIGFAVALSLGQ